MPWSWVGTSAGMGFLLTRLVLSHCVPSAMLFSYPDKLLGPQGALGWNHTFVLALPSLPKISAVYLSALSPWGYYSLSLLSLFGVSRNSLPLPSLPEVTRSSPGACRGCFLYNKENTVLVFSLLV